MRKKDAGARPLGAAETNKETAGRGVWAAIHQRLQASQAALDRRLHASIEEQRAVLRARAKLLAQEPDGKTTSVGTLAVVEFLLAHEHYAIESGYVREIHPLKEFTPLPCTPAFVLGLINVRGQIMSIIDIKKFFDLPERGLTDLNKVIIVQSDQMELGILADAILGVRSITTEDLQPSMPTLTGIRAEYLRGVSKDALVVLDAGKILVHRGIAVDEEPGTAG